MEFVRIPESEYPAWDRLVATSESGTLFHSSRWLQATGRPFSIYLAGDPERPVGGVAVAEQRVFGLRVAGGFPLTPYGGVVPAHQEGKPATVRSNHKDLNTRAAEFLQERYAAVSLRLPVAVDDIQPFLWRGYDARVRYTYVVDIGDLDRTWDSMDAARRRNVRRAGKDGVLVSREDDIEVMLELVRATYERQGKTPGFIDYARRLYHTLRSDVAAIFVARREGAAIAGAMIVWDQRCAYYLLGGIDHRADTSAAGPAVLWHAMRYAQEVLGLDRFDLEGSGVPAIEHYFRKFGGGIMARYDVRWSRRLLRAPLHVASRYPAMIQRLVRRST